MTQNQLRYWELRWKQWYEYQLLKQKERELAETKRSNRAREDIEYDKISISKEDLIRKWDELAEKKRAALVGEAINKYKADIEFADAKSRIDKRLSEIQIAEADLAIAFTKARNDDERQYIKLYADVADKGWDGVAGAAMGTLYANNKSQGWDSIAKQVGVSINLPTVGITPGSSTNTSDSSNWSNYVDKKKSSVIDTTGKGVSKTGYMEDSIHSITSQIARNKQGVTPSQMEPVSRDSYQSSPQTGTSVLTSKSVSGAQSNVAPSSRSHTSGSGVIITTSINKGPGAR